MSVPIDSLPEPAPQACERLRDGLLSILGSDLRALWVYGALTFPDPPALADIDTHGILRRSPDPQRARAIDELHEAIARDLGVEWDSWYLLESDVRGSKPPRHAFRGNAVDTAWALHRAHWLAGRYVLLSGTEPSGLVLAPTWPELDEGLRSELFFIEQYVRDGLDDPHHAAFSIWNGCRILYSVRTHDVVVSKREAARWGIEHLPPAWHDAIRAAGRVYDGEPEAGDHSLLQASMVPFASYVRDNLT